MFQAWYGGAELLCLPEVAFAMIIVGHFQKEEQCLAAYLGGSNWENCLSLTQMCPVIWRIVACILHIWDALLPLLFLGQSFLLIKSWWIELLLLACPQHEDWDNCSSFTRMVHTVSETSFFSPYFPFYYVFNKLAGIPSFCHFSIYIFTFWSVFFGLNSKGFIILQTQTENSISVEKLFLSVAATQAFFVWVPPAKLHSWRSPDTIHLCLRKCLAVFCEDISGSALVIQSTRLLPVLTHGMTRSIKVTERQCGELICWIFDPDSPHGADNPDLFPKIW